MKIIENKEICEICGKSKNEYDKNSLCKKNHDWRSSWRKDKTSKKYKRYLKRYTKSLLAAQRKKLDTLNKKPPKEYTNRVKKKGIWKKWKPEEA